jgi:hypothetical protein
MSRFPACLAALAAFSAALGAQDEPVPTFGITVVIPSGLHGDVYFIGPNSTRLPDFQKLKSLGTIYTTALNIPPQDFKQGFPGMPKRFEWFAIDYTGKFWIDNPGLYGFSLTSDDGSRLYIDDREIIDNDGIHPPEERTGSVVLTGGIHRIRVSYFQGPRFQVALVLRVAPPLGPLRVFSTDEFKPPTQVGPVDTPVDPLKDK